MGNGNQARALYVVAQELLLTPHGERELWKTAFRGSQPFLS